MTTRGFGVFIRKRRLIQSYSQNMENALGYFLRWIENILILPMRVTCIAFTWGTSMIFILYPNERKTRRYLKLYDHDDSRIRVPYEEFMASSPIIWEERKPISDFVFDVDPMVFLFKDGEYIEENLVSPWR